jgi:hypothetical protein
LRDLLLRRICVYHQHLICIKRVTYPAAVEAAAVPVLISSWAVASKLVRTTSPANMILFNNGRFVLEVGVGAADEVAEEGLLE